MRDRRAERRAGGGFGDAAATEVEELFGVEELGPVPDDLDYARKPHRFDFFTYMFDDFEGTKVTFCGSIRPIVQAFRPPAAG